MKKMIPSLAAIAASSLLISPLAQASQYKIVLIHGFQAEHLSGSQSEAELIANGADYWSSYWNDVADDRIDWSSADRIEGKIASDYVWPKLKQYAETGFCNQGCIFVTHSTGDIIARHIIENQETWLENAGLTPLNIVATFDLAGAGGGTELADLASNLVEGIDKVSLLGEAALEAWLGDGLDDELGVVEDLKVNVARNIAPNPDSSVPRIRFVADASDFLGATSPFMPGNDDGVVPSHSACGSSSAGAYGSCNKYVAFDGKLDKQDNAVRSFMSYHYPMLMSDAYSHGTITERGHEGKVTTVYDSVAFTDGAPIAFDTKTETSGSWFWKSTYLYVKQSGSLSMSELIYNATP